MTETQHERAKEIQSEIRGIKSELASWEYGSRDEIVCPLTLRLGGDLKNTPKQAFLDFKLACVTGMNKRLEELQAEFDTL